ncbi:MAG: response regulator transcription factor [Verrucomicrobiaceae bacterium]|nr:MAG: response regulator transcription factor [Verrucomicrobiaceae bacterium]
MPRILIIEDELPMRHALDDLLQAQGYRVITAADGATGLKRARTEKVDLLLLDVMLPKLDGYSLCAEVRRSSPALPILMITAKGRVDDRVTGLDAGADDYLVKPFSSRELLARVRALLRRVERVASSVEEITFGEVTISFTRQLCMRRGERVPLSAKEFGVLKLLAEHAGEPVTREQFLENVWGYNAYPTTRTVDNQILSLRTKLESDPANPCHLMTVHGVGYRLEMTEP